MLVDLNVQHHCSWRIENEITKEIIIITDLHKWCDEMSFKYTSFYGTLPRNKFHKGYRIVEKLFSPRNQYYVNPTT